MHRKINKLIKDNNIKQQQIAKKMEVKIPTVQMYLLGRRRITLSIMTKLTESICSSADENIAKLTVLKNELQKMLMDMSNSDSIRDV